MKVVSVIIICTIAVACSRYTNIAQPPERTEKKDTLVRVKDWGFSAMSFAPTYWEDNQEAIIKQIGNEEFEKVKSNTGFKRVPSRMSIYDGIHKPNVKEFNERMKNLKVYKIAAYTMTTQTKEGTIYERMNILRCPYVENKNWDSATKWDTVYFVVHEEVVEIIK